ncbi:tetratricopeptide repeat protein [Buchnera aphidicola]|uniref:UPF0162 protein YchA n=1 Tax=Buchnera aphidicola (Cinara strobi) TaxID=1921549 RepID=A0A3B1DL08_9GAMM|nr:tetratricopeptide repeat protein [Buchnera aphidicola]VAX76401.1 UPF0162 protein YchA [Buchnera aphidicola (Cinara strobi)]
MIDINNIDFSKVSLFETMITIMAKIRSDFSQENVMILCNSKVEESLLVIKNKVSQKYKLKKLLILFYKKWNFSCSIQKYKLSQMLWLDKVMLSHQGNAFSLGIIFMYIAHQLNLLIEPIIFPTQLILTMKLSEDNYLYFNPLNGDILTKHILDVWLKCNISPSIKLNKNHLKRSKSLLIIHKILDMLKIALIEEKNIELALNVSNILLTLKPKDPYEMRDRGLIFSQLNCYKAAISDLLYFVERCPEDPISDIIKIQIHSIEQKKITFH